MKALYYDCFCGISGEKNLGALLDLGVDKGYVSGELAKLKPHIDYTLEIKPEKDKGIYGTRAELTSTEPGDYAFADIAAIIQGSSLSAGVKVTSLQMLGTVREAIAKVEGKQPAEIRCATELIGYLIGAAVCLDVLGVERIIASPVQMGGGFMPCADGMRPVPAPAAVEMLCEVPLQFGLISSEVTDLAGAAFLAAKAAVFSGNVGFTIEKIGYGFGKEALLLPNVLRVYLGTQESGDEEREEQYILETNIDDMNPELFGYLEEKLFASGALDVYKSAIWMKKGRLATKVSVLVSKHREQAVLDVIFRETTALGLRKYKVEKIMLRRDFIQVMTAYGAVTVKNAYYQGKLVKYKPEYEECKKIAAERKVPIAEVYREVYRKLEEN